MINVVSVVKLKLWLHDCWFRVNTVYSLHEKNKKNTGVYSSAQWRSSTLTPLKNACLIWATWWCLLFGIMWPRPLLSKLFACDVVVKVWAIQSRFLWVKAFSRNMQNPKCKWWNVFAEDMGQVRVSCLTSPFGISDTDLAVSPPHPHCWTLYKQPVLN